MLRYNLLFFGLYAGSLLTCLAIYPFSRGYCMEIGLAILCATIALIVNKVLYLLERLTGGHHGRGNRL